jgi:hypothetical protein
MPTSDPEAVAVAGGWYLSLASRALPSREDKTPGVDKIVDQMTSA